MKILIVDDNSSFLMLFQVYAKDYPQFAFFYGESGGEALKILDSEKGRDISLIVSDMRMPEMSGIELSQIVNDK